MPQDDRMTRRVLLATTGVAGLGIAGHPSAEADEERKGRKLSTKEADAFLNQMKASRGPIVLPRTIDGTRATAQIVGGIVNNTFVLIVAGKKPFINMVVKLVPYTYVKQPDYWEIEVQGITSGIVLPAIGYYDEPLPLDSCRGKKGIEVIWADDRCKLEVPPATGS
jgi:hypothetical protein